SLWCARAMALGRGGGAVGGRLPRKPRASAARISADRSWRFSVPSDSSSPDNTTPDRACRIHCELQLCALVRLAQRIACGGAGKTALRADRQPIELDVFRSLFDAALKCFHVFQRRDLAADQPEHDRFFLRREA